MNQLEYSEIVFNSAIPYAERLLYMYLRSNCDFKTGVVGDADKKRISYQSIREALEYLPESGSHNSQEVYSRQRIYKLLKSLERRRFIVSLPPAGGPGPKGSIRKLLPLSIAQVRPQEEVYRRETKEGDNKKPRLQLVTASRGDNSIAEEGDTSVRSTLSLKTLSQYSSYAPDDSDYHWLDHFYGKNLETRYRIDLMIETETFNLRTQQNPDALTWSIERQQAEWRIWITRAVDYAKRRM